MMRFDFEAQVRQGWTDDAGAIRTALGEVAADAESRLGGTALFDALYTACHTEFGPHLQVNRLGVSATSNMILLFTDGEDNASHARAMDVARACQQAQTAIFVFSSETHSAHGAGDKVLQQLAAESGGAVFYDAGDAESVRELRRVVGGLRDDYVLVYRPAKLKADGSFHRVKLDCPTRDASLRTQTGYYAPGR